MDWNLMAEEYLGVADELFNRLKADIANLSELIAARLKAGGKVMICGNGGSAADAQHFAAELVNRFLLERKPYAALALSTDTSILTAVGNDYGYEFVFEKQVQALGKKGDILIAISTSGNASNACRAVEAAKALEITTVALTGGRGGRLAGLAERVLSVSSTSCVPRIQEGHQFIMHAVCERVEEILK